MSDYQSLRGYSVYYVDHCGGFPRGRVVVAVAVVVMVVVVLAVAVAVAAAVAGVECAIAHPPRNEK